jgi:hypothetical protein
MPAFKSRQLAVSVDMAGCPNRCWHCWVGTPPNRRVPEETLRWVAQQFREWRYPGEAQPFIERLIVHSWYREPDFAPNYRELWALEQELSDPGAAMRYELLSSWRLARDEGYARWARDIGTEACQITFFGLEETTDFFIRRRGAFRDSLLATERLLAVGIRPRWQLFLTTRILPELEGLLTLVREMRLDERVRALGQEFQIFIHQPGPTGEAYHIEHLRPTVDCLTSIPPYLVEKSQVHFGVDSLAGYLGKSEAEWVDELAGEQEPYAYYYEPLIFFTNPELDVYYPTFELMPWWRLGNLATDSIDEVMRRFEHDDVPGLQANFHVPVVELARRYGRRDNRQLYGRSDLIERWLRLWGEEATPPESDRVAPQSKS